MRIASDHRLTLIPPPGTGMLVLQVLLTPRSGPGPTINNRMVEMVGMDNAARFTDAFANDMLLVNIPTEGEIALHVTGLVETKDLVGVLGRVPGEPVPALYKRQTEKAKAPEGIAERFEGS